MLKLRAFLPKKWWSSFLWIITSYVVAVDLFLNLLLLVINCIGYLPYSDRPGPGWQAPHFPQKSEIGFFIGFALYIAVPALIYALVQGILGLIYGLCSFPRWLIRVCGGLTGFVSTGLLMASAGWMIAISALGVYIAAGSGLMWGVLILPLLVVKKQRQLPLAVRVSLPVTLVGIAMYFLIYPLLPHKPVPGITFEANRVTQGEEPISPDHTAYFRPETWNELDSLHLKGDFHGGFQVANASSDDSKNIQVMLVALQPIDHEYTLQVPEAGYVVYVLEGDRLTPHPAFSKADRRTINIKPGSDSKYEGGEVEITSVEKNFVPFTWYPTIKK